MFGLFNKTQWMSGAPLTDGALEKAFAELVGPGVVAAKIIQRSDCQHPASVPHDSHPLIFG